MRIARTPSPGSRLMRPGSRALTGAARRGKYTLVTSAELVTRLATADVSVEAKYVQARNPTRAKTGYGSPSLSIDASFRNTNVNRATPATGWMTAQATPNAACL